MTEFSLSKRKDLVFPDCVEDETGKKHGIRAGHQTILKIFRLLQDDDIPEHHRIAKACDLFLTEPTDMMLGYTLLMKFLNYGEAPEEEAEQHARLLDYEQDATEIYGSFLQLYGIDLIDTDLHWYRFNALMAAMLRVDNPLEAKLRLRTLDTSKLKGKDRSRAEAAKQSVALKERISKEDAEMERQLLDALQNGGDIAAILKQRT